MKIHHVKDKIEHICDAFFHFFIQVNAANAVSEHVYNEVGPTQKFLLLKSRKPAKISE